MWIINNQPIIMFLSILEAVDTSTILIALVAFLATYLTLDYLRVKLRLPPQPGLALPVIGHMHKLGNDPRPQFRQWRKQYGDIFSFYLGGDLVVVLNGYNTLKEALVKKGDEFVDRQKMFFDTATGFEGKGLICSNGENWKEHRTTIQAILRQMGVGKNLMAERISEEVSFFIESIEQLADKPINLQDMLDKSVSNVTCSMLIGKRLEYDDEVFQELVKMVGEFITNIRGTDLLNVFPVLRHIPGDPFKSRVLENFGKGIMDLFAKKYCQELSVDETNEGDNIIACYLREMNRKKELGLITFMDEESLYKIVFDLFIAGTDTTSTTMSWCILLVLHHIEVQAKAYAEILREVGTERSPNIHDRSKLTYVNALILETQRYADIAPITLPRTNPKDAVLGKFDIPKGSRILSNLGSLMEDPEIWGEDVRCFRPERFIDPEGHLIHKEEMIPFSIGRRNCIGESLSTMELFLFTASLFQRFQFLPVSEENLPTLEQPEFGLVIKHAPYNVRVVKRF